MKMWPGLIYALLLLGIGGSFGMYWIATHNPPEILGQSK